MSLRRLRRAVGGLIQKANKSDPIFREALRNDVVGRQFVRDHVGPIGGQAIAQPAAQQGAQPTGMPMRNDAGWQMQRVADLRARFGRPGGAVPSIPQPATPGRMTTMPVVAKPITSSQPGTMADSPIMTKPANPAAADMAAYSNAWQTLA